MTEPPLLLRAALGDDLPPPTWPTGIVVVPYDGAWAERFHALLAHAYASGFGSVAPYEEWRPRLEGDAEFDPALCLLATAGDELAGAILCWTSSFVKDLVVHERWRGCGLGRALLLAAFAALRARGADAVELKVVPGNATAIGLYRSVGMREA